MAQSFKQRLDRAAEKAGFSTADFATWFESPYMTVRAWRGGSEPKPGSRAQVEQRLQLLERAIARDHRLPIPLGVRQNDRKEWISGILVKYRAARRTG